METAKYDLEQSARVYGPTPLARKRLQHFQDPKPIRWTVATYWTTGTQRGTHTFTKFSSGQKLGKAEDASLLPRNHTRYYFAEHKTRLTNTASIRQASSTEQSVHNVRLCKHAGKSMFADLHDVWSSIAIWNAYILHSLKCAYTDSTRVELSHYARVKGKAIPLQALTGPQGSRRLRLPDFKTIGTW
jgi:hypothetical protein